MKTLLLIDASSYLYRAFHAMPDLRSPQGEPTGAVYGIVNMLRRLMQSEHFDYCACVFDAKGKTFRDELFPEYKAHRPSIPDELRAQIAPIYRLVRAFGWPLLAVEGVEADDVIGTLARQAEKRGWNVIISTGDKDFAQLVDSQITLSNSMNNAILDPAGVEEKFGVPPRLIIDYLSLIGDKVDNIPGVDKCGPKTAIKWLTAYGDLDGVMAHAADIGGAVGDKLREALPRLPLSRQLVTIKCDVDLSTELPGGLEDLAPLGKQTSTLAEDFRQHGFRSWLREVEQDEPQRHSAPPPPPAPPTDLFDTPPVVQSQPSAETVERQYHIVLTDADFDQLFQGLQQAEVVSFDTETNSLDPLSAKIVGMSFSWQPGVAWYLPLAHDYPGAPDQLPLQATLDKLRPWLEGGQYRKLGQNLKYDSHVLANYGIALGGIVDDTMLASYVLESHLTHNMDDLAKRHLDETTTTYEEICGKGAKQIGFAELDLDTATNYAAEDADITFRLSQALNAQLTPQLTHIYRDIELPAAQALFAMERQGVLIDRANLAEQSHQLGVQMLSLEGQIQTLAGQPFNISSPKQLQEILFGKLCIPTKGVRKTPSGGFSTDESVLEKLALDFPLPKLILEYRGLAKLKSTYTDKLPTLINPRTGRVHTTYAQAVVITGRLASSDPNLQNIPVRTAAGRCVREAFIAAPGNVIVSADYSQIELRIMAHLSEDENLCRAFLSGEDIHRATAAEVFGVVLDQVSNQQRRYAKSINFGLIYGMGAYGLASQLEISQTEAKQFIERYFARYPGVADYMQRTRESAYNNGYVDTIFGRRLYQPEIRSSSPARRAGAERAAINAPMQGTAADLIKMAMIKVYAWLAEQQLDSRLIMQVHDELVLEVPEAELATVSENLPRLMSGVAELAVPLLAEVGSGKNWEAAH